MAYRTATFDGEAAFAIAHVSTGTSRKVLRTLARHLALGVGAVAVVAVSGAAVIFSAAWLLGNAGVTHATNHAATRMTGPGTLALANDPSATSGARSFDAAWKVSQGAKLARPMIVEVPASALRPVLVAKPATIEVARLDAPAVIAVSPAAKPAANPATLPNVPLPLSRPNLPPQQELARAPVQQPLPQPAQQPAPQPAPQLASLAAPALPEAVEKRVPSPIIANPMGALPESVSRTAVYDITNSVVYMPDGQKMEAHSGLRDKMDDPRHIKVRMHGPTPPNVYVLTERESLFHGVRAIRLNPVDRARMFGRDGMLAHTYMLGPNGQSNGCVSFKNYDKFLQAFLDGKVDKLVVVADLGNTSWKSAALQADGVSVPAKRFATANSRARSYPAAFGETPQPYSPALSFAAPSSRSAGNL
ncbi:MAG: DUF2778 domain-containing protein [Pseudolabrys sp.]|nr:DUF2778 domain-containing protein [Pseudolabrys sp.]